MDKARAYERRADAMIAHSRRPHPAHIYAHNTHRENAWKAGLGAARNLRVLQNSDEERRERSSAANAERPGIPLRGRINKN